jgi:hypothetical protein
MSKPATMSNNIWNQMSANQKRKWRILYKDFLYEWGISDKKLTKQEKETIASNHATLAVWIYGA